MTQPRRSDKKQQNMRGVDKQPSGLEPPVQTKDSQRKKMVMKMRLLASITFGKNNSSS